jgi:hypothetical protein
MDNRHIWAVDYRRRLRAGIDISGRPSLARSVRIASASEELPTTSMAGLFLRRRINLSRSSAAPCLPPRDATYIFSVAGVSLPSGARTPPNAVEYRTSVASKMPISAFAGSEPKSQRKRGLISPTFKDDNAFQAAGLEALRWSPYGASAIHRRARLTWYTIGNIDIVYSFRTDCCYGNIKASS